MAISWAKIDIALFEEQELIWPELILLLFYLFYEPEILLIR
jgi:hypothetical protein